ncbi:MAG: subtilisin family serine protease [Paraglaciecola sp.]|jgi:subtilisin family serine protease
MRISSTLASCFAALVLLISASGLEARPADTINDNAAKDKYIIVFKESYFSNKFYIGVNKFGESAKGVTERILDNVEQNQRNFDNKKGKIRSRAALKSANKLGFLYSHAIKGFSATLTAESVAYLKLQPEIDYIEPDHIISVNVTQTPTPSWGLDRIDQIALPLNDSYNYSEDGTNVHAYIIDTGLRLTHNEFAGRVGDGFDFMDNDNIPDDCNGHGTHVAGTVAGQSYGVAKNTIIHPLKALGCDGKGPYSGIIAAVDWVRVNHQSPAVVNMSIGGPVSAALDSAINEAITAGITVVVAAGNEYGQSACNYSPARAPNAITVASTTSSDSRSGFSNIGTCVDLFAPGSAITSAWYTGDNATNTINGTSMASPHVAGVVANYLESTPGATPAQVSQLIINSATADIVTDAGVGTPNRLLNNGLDETTPAPAPISSTQDFYWNGGHGIAARWTFANVFDNGRDVYVTQQNNGQYYASQLNADGSIQNWNWAGGHGMANRWDFSNIFGGDRDLYVTHSNSGAFYATQLNSDGTLQNWNWQGGHGIANRWVFADIFGQGRDVYVTHSNSGKFYATQLNTDGSKQNWNWSGGHGIADRWAFADIFGEGRQVYVTHQNGGNFYATQLNSDGTVNNWKWNGGHGIADRWFMADIFGEGRQVYVTHGKDGKFYATQLNSDGTVDNWRWTGGHGTSDRAAFVDFFGTGQMVYVTHSNKGNFYITRLNKDGTVTNSSSKGHGVANLWDFADILGNGKKSYVTHSSSGEFYSTQDNQ